jgi:hypothetical protein
LSDVLALLVLHRRVGMRSGRDWRPSGYSARAAVLPYSVFLITGPAGLAIAIGASRPSRASVRVPRVYTSAIRGGVISRLSGKSRKPCAAAPG